jgi:hypothetical protein
VQTTVSLPAYTVKDCKAQHNLYLRWRLLPNSENEFEMQAQIQDPNGGAPMQVAHWQWTFGDGEETVTDTPDVIHDYAARAEDSLYSQLLVTCTAVSATGETVTGRHTIQLMNPAFEELATKHLVKLDTSESPRFPVLDSDGVVTEEVSIWHHRPDTVQITSVHAMTVSRKGGDPVETELSPVEVLGTDRIPTAGITVRISLDTNHDPDVAYTEYVLEGKSSEGYPAHGNFAIMRPPDLPTKDHNIPVTDPLLEAKIVRARDLLGKQYVTDEDLYKLDQAGQFTDLEQDPSLQAPPGSDEVTDPPDWAAKH